MHTHARIYSKFENHSFSKVLADSSNCNSYAGEKLPVDCTETVESCKIDKNNFDIDLENIFETVSKEHMDESEEEPKFIAKPPTGYAKAEDDDEEFPVVLPYFQRRTYHGKDLIFEDPIGSELIGDVEFEVDFDYIINDIQREMVDEERGLPIARVLPIYKTPPIYDEFERTVVVKDNREIDLNFNDLKIENFNEQENHKEILINTVTKDLCEPGREVITIDESRSGKDDIFKDTLDKNIKNADNIGGAEADIVEQKRLLLLSQNEERKKLRENRLRDNERNENSASISRTPVVRTAEQIASNSNTFVKSREREAKPQKNVNDADFSTEQQRKDDSSMNEKNDITWKISDSKQDSDEMKRNDTSGDDVTGIIQSMETESCDDLNSEERDKEEEERLREAEDKEKRLLERIKYLEKKRQQLYEKKQRELNTNNFTSNQENKVHGNGENKQNSEVNANKHRSINAHQTSSTFDDPWSKQSKKQDKENEEEKRRLAEALAAKRKTEAELETQREEILRAAKQRKLEEEEKQREQLEAAKQRKQTFLENLKRLKERVTTEEEDKAKAFKGHSKRETSGSVQNTAGRFNPSLGSSNKSQLLPGHNKFEEAHSSSTVHKSALLQTDRSGYKVVNVEANKQTRDQDYSAAIKHGQQNNEENEEDQRKSDELRRENFKSNRELFMRKVQTEQQVQRRENMNKNLRPKSHYGGMFNKPVHQIIDDSLLVQNVDSTSVGDLVDEESLKQFQREQELKKEHEKVNKLRSSLERESSYTVENVEQLFSETGTDNASRSGNCWDNLEKEKVCVKSLRFDLCDSCCSIE